jgi:phosphoadenosine phosphosulfate reductase
MLKETTLFENIDRVKMAIDRLRQFEPPEGYYLAFSGGKDSIVIKELAKLAGVKYDTHFHFTTVDPPELVRFIKDNYTDVIWERPEYSMYQLIVKKKIPPTRVARYCCEYLKEGRKGSSEGGAGRFIITGVRRAESFKRSKRRMVEVCMKDKTKKFMNVIVDWEDSDVWDFIKARKLPYCKLYDEGWNRIGCIGCPLSSNQKAEFERYPQFKKMYLQAFRRMLEERKKVGKDDTGTNWDNAESVMKWFMGESISAKGDPDQTIMFE